MQEDEVDFTWLRTGRQGGVMVTHGCAGLGRVESSLSSRPDWTGLGWLQFHAVEEGGGQHRGS